MMNIMSVKGKRVLVTGSAGVIGRELLKILKVKDANVLSVDRLPLPMGDYGEVKHIRMDLAVDNYDELIEFEPEFIIHLAAAFERFR